MATPPAAPLLATYNPNGVFSGPPASWPGGPTTNIANGYFSMDASSPWSEFGAPFIAQCNSNGLISFVELEGWNFDQSPILVSDITSGDYDTWLTDLGSSIAAGGKKCMITWNHEFNVSGQYPWAFGMTGSGPGGGNLTAAEWIAGWKYVHDKVRSTAGGLDLWMWAPGADTGGSTTTSPSPWWPGSSYVDMVGIDGYEALEGSPTTFSGVFGAALADIRALGWSGDIWVAETNLALMVSGGGDSITTFVEDMAAAGMSGVCEFEEVGLPQMTSAQWTEYNTAIAANFAPSAVTSTGSASMAGMRAAGQSGPITSTGSASLATVRAGSPVPLIPQPVPAIPQIPAGWRPDRADFDLWVTSSFSFLAQRASFRGQLQAAKTVHGFTLVQLDTVLEDPYSGWSAVTTPGQPAFSWMCPPGCGGWYEATLSGFAASQGSGTTNSVATALYLNGSVWQDGSFDWAVASAVSGSSGTVQVPLLPGDYVQLYVSSTASVSTPAAAGEFPALELAWVSS